MTVTNTLAPSDAELEALIHECRITVTDGQSAYEPWADLRPELTIFARAVLAKWGSPVVAGEPYAYAVYFPDQPCEELVHYLDDLTEDPTNREHAITKLYATPQPTQGQEEAVAQAVAAEREACAQLAAQTVCDMHIPTGVKIYGARAAKAIRARGTDAPQPPAQALDALKQVCAIAVSAAKTNSRDIADWREDMDRIAAIAAKQGGQ